MRIVDEIRQGAGMEGTSLLSDVSRIGLAVLPTDEVLGHKRYLAATSRQGIWKNRYLSAIPSGHARITDSIIYHLGRMLIYCLVAFWGGAYLGWSWGPTTGLFASLLTATVVGFLSLAFAYFFLMSFDMLERREWADPYTRSARYWREISFSYFEDEFFVSLFSMPDEIQERARRLERSLYDTGVKIYVEIFGRDSFIYVTRGSEIVYFGAWNTGTRLDHIGRPTLH